MGWEFFLARVATNLQPLTSQITMLMIQPLKRGSDCGCLLNFVQMRKMGDLDGLELGSVHIMVMGFGMPISESVGGRGDNGFFKSMVMMGGCVIRKGSNIGDPSEAK
ncbi:hypothetical protein HAX54_025667 [Datura stramonium]|uniref:Uncharacterized protein n=1 Tax=Datura stramonium TaxID=4076 RepID=A0ABS8V210_DATST|nr:hypothetical protein [Datura stramonium]